jgi:hypothetical protein
MLVKTLGWAIVSLCVASVVWWLVDPVGFASNPVFSYLKRLSTHSSEYFH